MPHILQFPDKIIRTADRLNRFLDHAELGGTIDLILKGCIFIALLILIAQIARKQP